MLDFHGAQVVSTVVYNVQTCCRTDTSVGAPTDWQWICFDAILGGVTPSYARCFLL
jgi:hypothetical protein